MSGECYPVKELMETRSNPKISTQRDFKGDRTKENVNQLLEYENMVSSAESKCTHLKGQLDHIKQLYANQSNMVKQGVIQRNNPLKIDRHPRSKSAVGTLDNLVESTSKSSSRVKMANMIRQNSAKIGTDHTGASFGTINNILVGITKSIKIPQVMDQINEIYKPIQHEQQPINGVESVKINTKLKQNLKVRTQVKPKRTNSKLNTKTSSTVIKKIKKSFPKPPERRSKIPEAEYRPAMPRMDKMSRRIIKRGRYLAAKVVTNPDLVEIYHNAAVKESRSSESDVPKKTAARTEEETFPQDVVPRLNMEADNYMMNTLSRSYELPTISSRLKKVAKYYMNPFNIKSIPFCVAASTSPSHNIGINMQQVMYMAKTRQQNQQFPSTLAYNIGLAAGRWEPNNENPLSFLVSSVTSRISSQCPLSKSTVNYQQLQEVAKTIPEKIVEEVDEELATPKTQSMIITGPSGDVKVTNRKQTVWSIDPNDKKCTCLPQKGIEFQQIINKFNGSISKSRISHRTGLVQPNQKNENPALEMVPAKAHSNPEKIPLQNKERKLKEVLKKLHDEFESMTKSYEDLCRKTQDGTATEEMINQLEGLDKDLNSKEEEIVMVMTLYKEVHALKQQVKVLKEPNRTSRDNVSVRSQHAKFGVDNSNTATASLLNKLLKQIQHFQNHYKTF